MNKFYCSNCKKEIKNNDIRIIPGVTENIVDIVCEKCYDEIIRMIYDKIQTTSI